MWFGLASGCQQPTSELRPQAGSQCMLCTVLHDRRRLVSERQGEDREHEHLVSWCHKDGQCLEDPLEDHRIKHHSMCGARRLVQQYCAQSGLCSAECAESVQTFCLSISAFLMICTAREERGSAHVEILRFDCGDLVGRRYTSGKQQTLCFHSPATGGE